MSGAQHTPAPWRIEGRRGAGYIISAGMNVEGDGPAGYVGVLDPMFFIAGEPSHLASDARLICAAPDLLQAAKRALNVLRATGESVRPHNALGALQAAISKAEGPP